MTTVKLTTAAEFCAAIPALLGYIPTESVAIVASHHGRVHVTINIQWERNLPAAHVAAHMARTLTRAEITEVRLCVIAARHSAELIALTDHIREALENTPVTVALTAHTWAIEHGAIWTDLTTGATGTMSDPLSTQLAAEHALQGRAIARNRTDIEDWFTLAEVAELPADTDTTTTEFGADVLTELIHHVTENGQPSPELAARTGALVLASSPGRDALMSLAAINSATAARVFTDLSAHLRGMARTRVLIAAAIAWHITGEGAVVNIALAAARAELAGDEAPAMLRLVEIAYQEGLSPARMTALISTGREAAAEFGITFP